VRAGWSFLLLWLVSTVNAAAEVRIIRTFDPRPFGYFIGDVIERSFEIETAAGDTLEPATVPRPGPVNYWLELREIKTASMASTGKGLHRLTLKYQTFYAPIDPRKIVIPPLAVSIASPSGTESVTLPAFTFISTPIREIFPEKSGETAETFLRPDPELSLVPVAHVRNWLLASGALSFLALTLLARQLAWWPFHQRPARPFSRAARDIAHVLRASRASSEAYSEASLLLHRAFDEKAARRVLASDAPSFIANHPEHRESAEGVARFFEASRAAFFGGDGHRAQSVLSGTALAELAFRLAREERRAR
jgi:mxaA protein